MTPTVPLRNNDENFVHVYEWGAWSNFLFPSLCTSAIRIEARVRQSNSHILKRLSVREGYFLFHINLTKPASFFKNKGELVMRLKERNITSLNAGVNDISKKYLQGVCKQLGLNSTAASVEGDENELLIVKTNFNYGGREEKKLRRSEARRLNLHPLNYNADINYPVMERKKIKNEDWNNENLVIEKYIANEYDHIYRVYKLLDKIVISEVIENNVIKKLSVVTQRTNYYYDLNNKNVLPVHNLKFNQLLTDVIYLCKAMHLDFAAVDVVKSDENEYYIIDVNLTPNWSRDDYPELLNFLAEGLRRK